jgi:hypothetical protein
MQRKSHMKNEAQPPEERRRDYVRPSVKRAMSMIHRNPHKGIDVELWGFVAGYGSPDLPFSLFPTFSGAYFSWVPCPLLYWLRWGL